MQYLEWYNRSLPHSKLEKGAPGEAYAVMLPMVKRGSLLIRLLFAGHCLMRNFS